MERKEMERKEGERKEKKKDFIQTASIIGGILAVIIFALILVCVCKRKSKPPKEEEYRTDENDVYGTYGRGWDGEGDYGDGDVVEVVDYNEMYGRWSDVIGKDMSQSIFLSVF